MLAANARGLRPLLAAVAGSPLSPCFMCTLSTWSGDWTVRSRPFRASAARNWRRSRELVESLRRMHRIDALTGSKVERGSDVCVQCKLAPRCCAPRGPTYRGPTAPANWSRPGWFDDRPSGPVPDHRRTHGPHRDSSSRSPAASYCRRAPGGRPGDRLFGACCDVWFGCVGLRDWFGHAFCHAFCRNDAHLGAYQRAGDADADSRRRRRRRSGDFR